MKKALSLILVLMILIGMMPMQAFAMEGTPETDAVETVAEPTEEPAEETTAPAKTISILGDSISTYENWSNGTAAQTTNSTISTGAIYYPRSSFDVTAESTWWYQAAEELGMEILVNNSWSGSCLLNTRSGTVGAYVDRCVQLHDDTGQNAGQKPDIIAIFLGTNDYYSYPNTLGTYETIDFDALIQESDGSFHYAQPVTSLEAYAISLHKISLAYPDAQVYCFTLLPRVNSSNQPTSFNEDICQLADKFGAHTVDLYHCGIQSESTAFYKMMGDNLHPDNPGMDAITNAFVSELLKNSDQTTYDVSFTLEGTVSMEGTRRTVVSGESFETVLTPLDASLPLEVTVTMGGMDITDSCWADSMVTIPSVTADVVIIAKPGHREPLNFRWETQADILVSVTSGGNTANNLTMTHGSITNGMFAKARFTMSQGISLRHDLPWCVEWKSSGTWTDTTDGALLFAEANTSATADACYFYRRHKNDFFAFGSYTGGKYHNYGVKLSGTGIDTTAEHVFQLENRIAADGSNMIWLKVDGEDVGPMNHHYIGGTDQKETVNWVSGKDFTFSYMGTNPHTIGGCSLEYIQVWEKGHAHNYESVVTMPTYTDRGYTTYTCTECGYSYVSDYTDAIQLYSYRWEIDNNTLVSVSANSNTANALTLDSGSVVDGILNKVRYTLQNEVWLYHDVPWAVEWCSTGNWSGMLLSSVSKSPSDGLTYLFRDPGSKLFAFGEYTGTWNNYGLILDCDMAVPHIFRLENRIAPDGTNMVYLLVDGEEVGAMHHHYVGGTNKNATVDWADGKDIVLRNIGTSSHPMSGMQLEYLHIWENGHNHSYHSSVTAPTCTEKGFTTYTCECGVSHMGDYVDATGHTYENGTCTLCGAAVPSPYAGKTIACIGDSITYGVGVTRDQTDYVTLLAKSLEMDYIRLGASGTTLCTDGHATCNIKKLTEANLAGADVVTILMGINDFVQAKNGYYSLGTIDSTDTSTIYGSVHMWCQKIEELRQTDSLRDTEFYFMTPVITSWNNSVSSVRNWDQAKTNIHGYRLRDLCNAIIEVCALYDIPVIDLNLISGLYYNSTEDNNIDIFGGDGAHPGAAGHQMMASAIENALLQNHLRDDHNHFYGSWITTTWPSCCVGEQQRVCTVCSATESRSLEQHEYSAVITAPTCTEQGYTTYTCNCGDSYVDDFVEAHSATKVTDAAVKANSLRPGLTEGSHCSACGVVLEPQEEISAKGYDWMLDDGEFKILLIGNSFSQDASSCGFGMTESQLYNMFQAMLGDDVKVTLGLLYSGGKGVHWYATQTEQGTKAPSFYTITPKKTVWTSWGGTSTETALTWTDWDVVTLQPYDVNFTKEQEGVPEKYKAETDEKFYPLETATEYMLDFIGTHAPQADVYCYMHWARSSATVASLNASLSTYQKFAAFYPKCLDYLGTETGNQYASIIPVGLSIQNARTTYLSKLYYNVGAAVDLKNDPQIGLQRDGGHVTYNVGRYIAGLTFAEMLIPAEMRAEGYVLPGIRVTESVGKLPEEYTEVAQKAVFAAVESWRKGSLEVTNLEEYAQDPAISAREELEPMTLNLTCGDENALIVQIREKVLSELPAEFVVEAVAMNVEKNTAVITLRFGYTSVEAEMTYTLTDHNFENGICTGCGEAQPGPVITQQPVDAEAKLGEKYMVEVKAEGENLKYQWYFRAPGSTVLYKSGVTDNTYDDIMTTARAGREVYCVITDANGNSVTTETARLICIPTVELEIVTQPVNAEAILGDPYCVTVEARGDDLKYQWYFRNAGSDIWYTSGVRDNTYDDIMTRARAGREIYCVITDACGNSVTTDVVTLVRIPIKLEILSQPTDASAYFNERFCATVEAKGEGLKYQWYFRSAGSNIWYTSGVRDNTYDDVMTKARNGREVYCVITDEYGNSVTTDIVKLMAVPKIELKLLGQTYESAVMGERYCVTVAAEGDELIYQWYFRNAGSNQWYKSGVTDNTYDDVMTKARAGREVYCVITDAFGHQVTTEIITLELSK